MDHSSRRTILTPNLLKSMKLLPTFLFTVFASGLVLAAPPQSHRPDRYKDLYLKSMFTDPPPPEEEVVEVNDLPDWTLVGVSKYVGRVEVEVMNVKDRTRVRIPGADATEMGFKIKEVKQGGNYIDETVVILEKGSSVGEVRFDAKYLVLKKVAGPATNKGKTSGKTNTSTNGRGSSKSSPPIPGSRPSGKTGSTNRSTPRPGTSTSNVPRPTTNATQSTNTKSTGTSSNSATTKKRSRWISPSK